MANVTILPVTEEPEERIERALLDILASVCTIRVDGALAPVEVGDVKHYTEDTFVSVLVDLASQDLDLSQPATFVTLTAFVTVRVSSADDADGALFRDECRRVRAALVSLTGDECERLGDDALSVDGMTLDSTSTSFESGDDPISTKTYTATLHCRAIHNTNNEQE